MAQTQNTRIFRTIFSVTGIILVSKMLGFLKQMVTASTFGATIETDLISLSEGFVGNIHYVLIQVLLTSFVAVYLHVQTEEPKQVDTLAVNVGKAFTVFVGIVVLLLELLAPQIARIIAPSYATELNLKLARYLRLFSPTLLFFAWGEIFHALLNANKRFIPGEMQGMNQSIILILCVLFLKNYFGVQVLAVAFVIYVIVNTLFLGVASHKYLHAAKGNPFKNAYVKRILKMAGPMLLGYSMVYINEIVGKILVSGLEPGTVTAMGYAAVLSNLVSTFVASFCSILFSYITAQIAEGNHEEAANLVQKSTLLLMILFLPVSIITIMCSRDIITVVYGRGAFTAENVEISAAALTGYAVMFVPLVIRDMFSRFQYGYQNSKNPMINSTIGIIANIVLSVLLCPQFGVFGVTIASSISVIICGVLNIITSRRSNSCIGIGYLVKRIPWLCIGGLCCYFMVLLSWEIMPMNSGLFRFTVSALFGFAGYLVAMFPLLLSMLKIRL